MNRKIVIALFSLVVLILLALLLFGGTPGQSKYSNWKSTYDFNSFEPQDLGILRSLIQKHTKDSVYILDDYRQIKHIKSKKKATYIFVGSSFYMPNDQFYKIKKYIDSGSILLVSYDQVNTEFHSRYFKQGSYFWEYNDLLYQWVGDTSLRYAKVYQNDTIYNDWYLFNKDAIKDTNYRAYMFAVNHPTAFYEKVNKGQIHFHSNPELFKNYNAVTPNGYAHIAAWLKWIPKNQDVIIMKFAVPPPPPDYTDDSDNGLEEDNSYLQFIINNDALRTSLFFIIGVIILFIVFRTKRRENIITGIEPKRNMSVVFVETLSSIYLAKNSPAGVKQVMRKNFNAQINRHFYIDLTRKETQEQNILRLIEKTGYPAEKINEIMKALSPRSGAPTNQSLGVLYRQIDAFYKATGVRKEYDDVFVQGRAIEIYYSPLIGGLSLVASIIILLKGMQLLMESEGLGMPIAIGAAFLMILSLRAIMLPILSLNNKQLRRNYLLGRKRILPLSEHISFNATAEGVEFTNETGRKISIKNYYLTKRSKNNLSQIVAHIKRKTL